MLVAGDQALMNIVDLVIDTSRTVVGKRIECNVRHVRTQAAIALRQPRRNGARRRQQRSIIGGVSGFAAIEVGTQTARQHQHHQQQRQVPQQSPAQAVEFTHHGFPASNPGHGRSQSRLSGHPVFYAADAHRFQSRRGWPLHPGQTPGRPIAPCS